MVLALGIVYMLVMRFMLKGDAPGQQAGKRRTFRDLIREYRLTGRARRLAIRPGSPMVDSGWTTLNCANVTAPMSSALNAGGAFGGLSSM